MLEGGSIHVDGASTCLTTEECLLSPGRNPHLSKLEIENFLIQYLNVEKVLWIPRCVFCDETSGHVDNLACFIRPGVVALTWTDDRNDPQYERSAEAYDFLMSVTDAHGLRLEVHKVHQPDPVLIQSNQAQGVDFVERTIPRQAGDRLAEEVGIYSQGLAAFQAGLARRFSDVPAAEASFNQAIDLVSSTLEPFSALKQPRLVAQAQLALGAIYKQRGDTLIGRGDRSGGRAAYEQSQKAYQACVDLAKAQPIES